jgi:8-oxo-dGTP pyrophosphatase MutT (NUDIX family)
VTAEENLLVDDASPLKPGDATGAILLTPDGRYLLQLRDNIRGIFFPDHWGLFGGGTDPEDASPEAGLCRELGEELNLAATPDRLSYFTNFDFDFRPFGHMQAYRTFYVLTLTQAEMGSLKLGEGREMRPFTAREALSGLKLAPYDFFVIWMHANQSRLRASAGNAP